MIGDWRYLFRFALGVLFIWAALAKIADIDGFASDVHNFHILPVALENLFAMVLPWIEVVAGLLLVMNVAPRSGTAVLGALLIVFLFAIVSALVRNLDIACGCFGTRDAGVTGMITLFRDIGFLALAVLGYPWRNRDEDLPEPVQIEA
ncbi:MAG TPA: MauE/DoxX family redox-associated membrane protein [Candidatus Eisenbacteria bacterium]|nr:MauE/DoxX family redox-associated membrane protein [Candidatus Eisenbacteria bacterium]